MLSAQCRNATLRKCRRVGKMLVFAAILGCLDPVLTVAAAISSRSPFVSPLERREAADAAKRGFAREQSDHLAVMAAYQAWRDARAEGRCAQWERFLILP